MRHTWASPPVAFPCPPLAGVLTAYQQRRVEHFPSSPLLPLRLRRCAFLLAPYLVVWHDTTRHGTAWYDVRAALHNAARCGAVRVVYLGTVCFGTCRFGLNVNERGDGDADNLGYVHRFPDLLKRWDDVDGDRGTWCVVLEGRGSTPWLGGSFLRVRVLTLEWSRGAQRA